MRDLNGLCLRPDQSLREAMLCIDRNAKGIALALDAEQRLLFTITDGDLRRAVLNGLPFHMTVGEWARKTLADTYQPIAAAAGTPKAELLRIMHAHTVRHVPLLDGEGRVVDLALLSDLVAEAEPPLNAVIMAGGMGVRLLPLTADTPKPMLPIGNRPLMEHILKNLREAGVQRVSITTHYKPEAIIQHFGDGHAFGIEIRYVNEDRPLGTAGSLGLMAPWDSPLLVMNGDILTRLNHRAMVAFHRENKAVITVGVRQYDVQVPYGLLNTEGLQIRGLSEKPTLRFFVNAGVYLLEPIVRDYLVPNEKTDMTDLISRLIADGHSAICFPISEYWLDIGQHTDYEKAKVEYAQGNF